MKKKDGLNWTKKEKEHVNKKNGKVVLDGKRNIHEID